MRAGAIQSALDAVARHPDFRSWVGTLQSHTPAGAAIDFDLQVEMPPAWAAVGQSPTGVRLIERVTLHFDGRFPGAPPHFRLRADFPRTFPHLQPGSADTAPRPCLVAGSESNLYWSQGLPGMLRQLSAWLLNAARGTLNADPVSWEPARRDSLDDVAIVDLEKVRQLPAAHVPLAYLATEYVAYDVNGEFLGYRIFVRGSCVPDDAFWRGLRQDDSTGFTQGNSLAVVLSPRLASGQKKVIDEYAPDVVSDLPSLRQTLQNWGCLKPFDDFLQVAKTRAAGVKAGRLKSALPILVVVNVARPRALAGSRSTVESFGYIVRLAETGVISTDKGAVRYAGLLEDVSPGLLRRFNQEPEGQDTRRWGLVGAGSLGSKIALHLARAGRAPSIIVDDAMIDSHNFARHSTLPPPELLRDLMIPRMKSWEVGAQIEALAQQTTKSIQTIEAILRVPKKLEGLRTKSDWLLLNTTASPLVRQVLIEAGPGLGRIAEASLFGEGRIGYFGIEGPGRNPDTGDLFVSMLSQVEADPALARQLVSPESRLRTIQTGVGCGSETMAATDADISVVAALIAGDLLRLHRQDLPASGSVAVGLRSEDELSIQWQRTSVAPFTRVELQSRSTDVWKLHLSSEARSKIEADVERYPNVETGGVIWGCVDEALGVIYVLDIIDAPPDSERGPTFFRLGKQGLREALTRRTRLSHGHFHEVGTWHSHLQPSGPSKTDREAGATIAASAEWPHALLIWTPDGYAGLLAEKNPPRKDSAN